MSEESNDPLAALTDAFNSFVDAVKEIPPVEVVQDDCRLYFSESDGWQAHVMQGTARQYCYAKAPGQDYFHLIITGEIFVQKGDEKYCLMCALRQGLITTNRLHWQTRAKSPPSGT